MLGIGTFQDFLKDVKVLLHLNHLAHIYYIFDFSNQVLNDPVQNQEVIEFPQVEIENV